MPSRIFIILTGLFFSSCAGFKSTPKYQLQDGYYKFHQAGEKPVQVYVALENDSIQIRPIDSSIKIIRGNDEYFSRKTIDVDAISMAFKYRPESFGFPRQLNTNFNGNIYLGYRVDRFWLDFKQTPAGLKKQLYHRAFTAGAFSGIGSTFVSPWTTRNLITDEYDGFILSRGLAAMAGINNLTVGFAVGWDYLTDVNKASWIYQNKPWLGLSIGLNIN
ncbi:MAG: hypothetical protein BroJett042_15680 [Bacteroidota bacterium]|nr:MAG: hypothetical protein BroJett042_15680 [Bacteroidota bacterium]